MGMGLVPEMSIFDELIKLMVQEDLINVTLLPSFWLFQALLESHDVVAEKSYEHSPQQEPELPAFELPVNGMTADAIRIVGLRKSPNEPLVKFDITDSIFSFWEIYVVKLFNDYFIKYLRWR